jgi:hypothetical protein
MRGLGEINALPQNAALRTQPMEHELEITLANFSRIYLGGIPCLITNDSAFLSFVCMVTATDALSGYRYGDTDEHGRRIEKRTRFTDFVRSYFPEPYKEYAEDIWTLRKKLVHAFSTGRFLLTHHNSHSHLSRRAAGGAEPAMADDLAQEREDYLPAGLTNMARQPAQLGASLAGAVSVTGAVVKEPGPVPVVLNAEDFYSALLSGAQRYFGEVRGAPKLQQILRLRLRSEEGGAIGIREIEL